MFVERVARFVSVDGLTPARRTLLTDLANRLIATLQ